MTDDAGGQPPQDNTPGQPQWPIAPGQIPPGQYGQPQYGQPQQPYGQQYGQQPYGQPYGQQPFVHPGQAFPNDTGPRNGLGTAALVCGIVAAVLGFVKFAFFLSIVLGILAVIFGLVGHSRGRKGMATNGRNALIGAVLGAIGVVVGIVWIFVLINDVKNDTGIGRYFNCVSRANGDQVATRQCADRYLHPTDTTTGFGS